MASLGVSLNLLSYIHSSDAIVYMKLLGTIEI